MMRFYYIYTMTSIELENLIELNDISAIKKIATLFLMAMNDWPLQNLTNVFIFNQIIHNEMDNSKIEINRTKDCWKMEAITHLTDIKNLEDEMLHGTDLFKRINMMLDYYSTKKSHS